MKKTLLALLFAGCVYTATAQVTEPDSTTTTSSGTVEKSLFNVQIGAGIFGSHEAKLSDRWVLRTELSMDLWWYDDYRKQDGITLAPSITLEPRWYYNIAKRYRKGRNTENNSANFVTVMVRYTPDLFTLGGPDYIYIPNQVSIIPKWGIRRAIAKSNFNYEVGIGMGYLRYLSNPGSYDSNRSEFTADLHLRLGYTFK